MNKKYYVYILSNYSLKVLYIGVTNNLSRRLTEHQQEQGSKFTSKYKLKVLLYYETYESIAYARDREKQLKNWHREWKWNLIKCTNPELNDLFSEIV